LLDKSLTARGASKSNPVNNTVGFVEKSWDGGFRDVARVKMTSSWHDLCAEVFWDDGASRWRLAACDLGGGRRGRKVITKRVRLNGDELVPPPSPQLPRVSHRGLHFINPSVC
jgi:hypothetical protein